MFVSQRGIKPLLNTVSFELRPFYAGWSGEIYAENWD